MYCTCTHTYIMCTQTHATFYYVSLSTYLPTWVTVCATICLDFLWSQLNITSHADGTELRPIAYSSMGNILQFPLCVCTCIPCARRESLARRLRDCLHLHIHHTCEYNMFIHMLNVLNMNTMYVVHTASFL